MAGNKNSGRRPKPKPEPIGIRSPPGKPVAPDWLSELGKQCFAETVESLARLPGDVLSVIDRDAIASYCGAWEDYHTARADCLERGYVLSTPHGEKANPAAVIMNKAADQIRAWCGKFGFSPADRLQWKVAEQDKGKSNPVADLVAKRLKASKDN